MSSVRTLLVFGGEGNRDDADDDDTKQDQDDSQSDDSNEDDLPDGVKTDDDADGDNHVRDLENQLDAEKKERIKLKRQLDALQRSTQKKQEDDDNQIATERDEFKQKYEQLESMLNGQYLKFAIKSVDKYKWHDVDDVMNRIDQEQIRIDLDTGEVEGLELQLKDLAKKKPYLLVKDQDDRQPSGSHPHGGRTSQADLDRDRLGKKYKIPGFGSANIRPV